MIWSGNSQFNIRKNQDGSAAVEFALVAPVLALILFGIIETSMIMYTTSVMEGATISSSRLGKTGYFETNKTRQQLITEMMTQRCGAIINPANITITTKSYGTFSNISQPEAFIDANHNNIYDAGETFSDTNGNGHWDADMGVAGLGNANDIVLYTVSYPWPIMTPFMRRFLGTNGTYTITSSMLVKNEPYNVMQVVR